MLTNMEWTKDALCGKPQHKDVVEKFFSIDADDRYVAKNICFSCPVRKECLAFALDNNIIWGVWGGKDHNDLRRTLSLNAAGNETRRRRMPQCPWCGARTSALRTRLVDVPGGGRWNTARAVECLECGFSWKSRSSSNAVKAYMADKEIRDAKQQKIREAQKKKREALRLKNKSKGSKPRIKQLPSTGTPPKSANSPKPDGHQ